MSYSTDSYIQKDTCTFPMYQRLRKQTPMPITLWMPRNKCNKTCVRQGHCGIAPCKWPTDWDTYIPITGGPKNGWQTRETGRHCTEASPS